MPNRRNRRRQKASSTAVFIKLIWQAIVAVGSAIALTIVTYYQWTANIVRPKHRLTAQIAPVCLVAIIMALGAFSAPYTATTTTAARQINRAAAIEPIIITAPVTTDPVTTDPITTDPAVTGIVTAKDSAKDSAKANETESNPIAPEPEGETYVEPEPLHVYIEPASVDTGSEFVAGSCQTLKEKGLGPFYRSDVNYTSTRDRDSDGIACEGN